MIARRNERLIYLGNLIMLENNLMYGFKQICYGLSCKDCSIEAKGDGCIIWRNGDIIKHAHSQTYTKIK